MIRWGFLVFRLVFSIRLIEDEDEEKFLTRRG
jgi:hypothetical protein